MKTPRSFVPVVFAAAAAMAAAFAVASTDAVAQNCGKDAGGGCKNDGAKCAPPNGGKCWTVKERRVLNCVCSVNRPPNALRTRRPQRGQQPPTETPQD